MLAIRFDPARRPLLVLFPLDSRPLLPYQVDLHRLDDDPGDREVSEYVPDDVYLGLNVVADALGIIHPLPVVNPRFTFPPTLLVAAVTTPTPQRFAFLQIAADLSSPHARQFIDW